MHLPRDNIQLDRRARLGDQLVIGDPVLRDLKRQVSVIPSSRNDDCQNGPPLQRDSRRKRPAQRNGCRQVVIVHVYQLPQHKRIERLRSGHFLTFKNHPHQPADRIAARVGHNGTVDIRQHKIRTNAAGVRLERGRCPPFNLGHQFRTHSTATVTR